MCRSWTSYLSAQAEVGSRGGGDWPIDLAEKGGSGSASRRGRGRSSDGGRRPLVLGLVVVVVMLVLGSGAGETGGAALHGHAAARLLSISRPVPQFRRPDRGLLTDKMM